MSLNGMFDSGPTTAAADAPLAKDKETPTTPNAGATSFRRLRIETCFVLGILQSPSPIMFRLCTVGFPPASEKRLLDETQSSQKGPGEVVDDTGA